MAEKQNEHIYMAKLAEQMERYEDMVAHMKKHIEINKELKDEERNLLSIAYKNTVGQRRTAWRAISAYEMKEKTKGSHFMDVIKYYKQNLEKELRELCLEIVEILEKTLLKKNMVGEPRIYYLKMMGDYYRYLAEFSNGEELKKYKELARAKYSEAVDNKNTVAGKGSEPVKASDPIRLGLALNFSVFYYEIMNDLPEACRIAKQAFDDAMNELDNLEDEQYKDSTTIMQLIRDNLTNWTAEMEENIDDEKK